MLNYPDVYYFFLFFIFFQTHHLCKFNLTSSTIGGDNALKELLANKQEYVTSGTFMYFALLGGLKLFSQSPFSLTRESRCGANEENTEIVFVIHTVLIL